MPPDPSFERTASFPEGVDTVVSGVKLTAESGGHGARANYELWLQALESGGEK
jgi:hypothetical protein